MIMPWFIQRRDAPRSVETIDEFDNAKEAHRMAKEYNAADPSAWHYVSRVPCKSWRESN